MASLEKYELMETELTAISTADSELSMRYYYSKQLAWQMEPTTGVVYILDKQINKMAFFFQAENL